MDARGCRCDCQHTYIYALIHIHICRYLCNLSVIEVLVYTAPRQRDLFVEYQQKGLREYWCDPI